LSATAAAAWPLLAQRSSPIPHKLPCTVRSDAVSTLTSWRFPAHSGRIVGRATFVWNRVFAPLRLPGQASRGPRLHPVIALPLAELPNRRPAPGLLSPIDAVSYLLRSRVNRNRSSIDQTTNCTFFAPRSIPPAAPRHRYVWLLAKRHLLSASAAFLSPRLPGVLPLISGRIQCHGIPKADRHVSRACGCKCCMRRESEIGMENI